MTEKERAAKGTLEAMYREMKRWSYEVIDEMFIAFLKIYNAKYTVHPTDNRQ
jgi:hypothetical protein